MVLIIGPTLSVYASIQAVIVASSITSADPGPGGGTYRGELAATAKTNEMTRRIGPVTSRYDPELMSFLSGEV
jgi:hypothetical protein